jgi:hypothetical protein
MLGNNMFSSMLICLLFNIAVQNLPFSSISEQQTGIHYLKKICRLLFKIRF